MVERHDLTVDLRTTAVKSDLLMYGKCEIDPEVDCAWQLIIDRLKNLNALDKYEELMDICDWSKNRDGGPRTMVREDFQR